MNEKRPPEWLIGILDRALRKDFADEFIGDLVEGFYWRLEEKSSRTAYFRFFWECFISLRFAHLQPIYLISIQTIMIRNYLITTLRHLKRHATYSMVNIIGLSIGVAAFLIIFTYGWQVLQYDQFHEKKDRIFMLYKDRITPNGTQASYDTWVPLKNTIKEEYPQVVASARQFESDLKVKQGTSYTDERVLFTDGEFFDIFSFKIQTGNKSNALKSRNSVVLSEEYALKYFGNRNAVGQEMQLYFLRQDTTIRFEVTAVLESWPTNSSFQPNLIVNFSDLPFYDDVKNSWGGSFIYNWVLLDDEIAKDQMIATFPALVEKIWDKETEERTKFQMLPLESYFDTFIGSKKDAWILIYISLGILLMACINFMNLTSARASDRAKEIGIRKALGAHAAQVRGQFLSEALFITLMSSLIGLILVVLLAPWIDNYFDIQLSFEALGRPLTLTAFFFGFVFLIGTISGLYPAIILSRIALLSVIRGFFKIKEGKGFRNVFVVVQFMLAAFLITGAIMVRKQLLFMKTADAGYKKEAVVMINASFRDFTDRDQAMRQLETYRNKVANQSFVNSSSLSYSVPFDWIAGFTFVRPEGWTGDPMRMGLSYVDANFLETMNIPILEGRNFLDDSEGDQRNSVILNEAAMKAFGFNSVEGNVIQIGNSKINVIGKVGDFHYDTFREEVQPTLIFHRNDENLVHRYMVLRVNTADMKANLDVIQKEWEGLEAAAPFSYRFLDEQVELAYEAENRFLRLVGMFTVISIIIAILGLFGLTSFIVEKKRKEISIRKVVGADISGIVILIFRNFATWVIVGLILGIPLSYYFLQQWLEQFHYRIGISWDVYLITGIVILLLSALSVGYQSFRASQLDPVKYLKDE